MKQLIEEQKKEFDAFRCTCVRKCGEFDPDHNSPDEVWNWHKQSLKQFIDGLITWQEEEVRHPLETVEHLKEIKENITNQPPL